MKKTVRLALLATLVFTLLIDGCASTQTPVLSTASPLPKEEILSTDTLVPTNTQVPTSTPEPTRTPISPTATIPAPEKSFTYLNNVKVVHVDTFDEQAWSEWEFGPATIKNGSLELNGKNWNGLTRKRDFEENQGIIVDFNYSRGSVFELMVDNGDWWTDPYKRFGIYVWSNTASVNVWSGKNGLGGARLSGNFSPKPDTAYSLLMAILPDGEFLGAIWEPANPTKTIFYREKIGKKWTGLTWHFKMGADKGIVLFDNYREIEFDGVK